MFVEASGKTRIVAIYGDPVSHSLSPRMHNAAFAVLGLDMVYVPFLVRAQELEAAMDAVRALNLVGVNLTQPHKIEVLSYLDLVDGDAERIGAVNTVVNDDGKLKGYNTDGAGFIRSLEHDYDFDPGGRSVVLFGGGGAARGICSALSEAGPHRLIIVNRNLDKAEKLASEFHGTTASWDDPLLPLYIREADLLINTTSKDIDRIHPFFEKSHLVYDIVYGDRESSLICAARGKGARTANGRSMLLHQGALGFKLWTGMEAPLEEMRRAIDPQSGNTLHFKDDMAGKC